MYTPNTGQDRGKDISNRQVVIIMRMEIEAQARITLQHLPATTESPHWIQDAQRIGQHEMADRLILQGIHKLEDILRRVLYAIRPILQIKIYLHLAGSRLTDHRLDILDMGLGSLTQLLRHMLIRAFAQ